MWGSGHIELKQKEFVEILVFTTNLNSIIQNFTSYIMAISKSPLYPTNEQLIAGFAKSLGHPARLTILTRLYLEGPLCVQILAQGHPISLETLSEHLKILREDQLVTWEERFPYTFYDLDRANMKKVKQYLTEFLNGFQEEG
jgi:DNA-binding transcriptional ArsR family regulator